jgi:large subunit ribosomal protein L1
MRLPHPVKTDLRICVIAPEDSAAGRAAKAAGASLVGEDHVFDMIKDGRIEFDRCLCHVDSLVKLSKSGVARILGPRGLMPSAKTNSVVKDVSNSVKDMVGASEYRERMGVVRMSIGQLGFTPEEVQRNIKAFMDALKKDMAALADRISKEIHERRAEECQQSSHEGFEHDVRFRADALIPDGVTRKACVQIIYTFLHLG